MKSLLIIVVLLFTFKGIAASIEINEAIKTSKIKVSSHYERLGDKGLTLTITNLTAGVLSISIPAGTTFKSSDEEQELINLEHELLALNQKEVKTIEVGGYCMELNKIAPRLESNFKVGKTKNTLLLSLLEFLKTNKPSPSNYQEAVWAITNGEPISSIEVINEADKELRSHIAKLTNRPNPWYSKDQKTSIEPGRPIERSSISVSGNMEVSLPVDTPFKFVVLDDKGNEKAVIQPKASIIKNVEHSFRFALTVAGWNKGKYKIVLKRLSDNSSIKTFDFEI